MKCPMLKTVGVIVLTALTLFLLSVGTREIAETNDQKVLTQTMKSMLPGSETFQQEEYTSEDGIIQTVYKGETGFVIETVTQGYASQIRMLVGVSKDGAVTGLVVKDMHETPGLGAKALTDWRFLAQFLLSEGDADVGTNVDALSGATVTSKAVARSVNAAVGYVTGADVQSGATSWGG